MTATSFKGWASSSTTTLLVTVVIGLIACGWASNYCCRQPDFSTTWCKTSDCIGEGCRNQPGEEEYQCADVSECMCRPMLFDPTVAYCTLERSCTNAKTDFDQGREMSQVKTGETPNEACLQALARAVCAYHFPRCTNDEIKFPTVCEGTCTDLQDACGISLDEIALVQGRCEVPDLETASSRKAECTAAAPPRQAPTRAVVWSLVLVVMGALSLQHGDHVLW